MDVEQRIAANLKEVRQRIEEAAQRSGRDPHEVTMVAVTKYVGIPATQALIASGCLDLGESRPQGLWEKAQDIDDSNVRWHMIGHLQRNKVRRSLPLVWLTHSADSPRLIDEIDRVAAETSSPSKILLEVNISGDAAKHGFAPEELPAELPRLVERENIAMLGLMAMASLDGDLASARRDFAALRQLRDRLQAECPPSVRLDQLSMGMSRDYEVAIEEGATLVRVGSALFQGIDR